MGFGVAERRPAWIGADPGGKSKFGVAALSPDGQVSSERYSCALEAVEWVERNHITPLGVGVDAPLWWSSGPSGARRADQWLRDQYPPARKSVMFINSMRGGVLIQGFLFAAELRRRYPKIPVTEAHPKLLLHARQREFGALAQDFGLTVDPQIVREDNDDRRDAIVAALAAREGFSGNWSRDLAGLPPMDGEQTPSDRQLTPVNYWWFD